MKKLYIIKPKIHVFPNLELEIQSVKIVKETKQRFYLSNNIFVNKAIVLYDKCEEYYSHFTEELNSKTGIDCDIRLNLFGEQIFLDTICCLEENLEKTKDLVLMKYSLSITNKINCVEAELIRFKTAIKNVEEFLLTSPN